MKLLYYLFAVSIMTLLALFILAVIGYIIYFGYGLLGSHPVVGWIVMISPLIFIVIAFEAGEYL